MNNDDIDYYDENKLSDDIKFYRQKCNYYISYNTAINLLHTFDYAKFCGRPLNFGVTINFYEDFRAPEKFQKIRRKIFRWLRDERKKSGYPLDQFWAFSFENPHYNVHLHLACHVEDELREEFQEKIIEITEKISPSSVANRFKFDRICVLTDKIYANYMIKGVEPDTAKLLHIGHICEYQGPIYGQRARSCMKLSRTARKKTGFRATVHRHLWMEMYPHLLLGLSVVKWNASKVVPNAAVIRTVDKMFDAYEDENSNLLNSGIELKQTGHRRYRKTSAKTATELGLRHSAGSETRNSRSGAAGRRNYAIPALTTGKHFQYGRIS